MNAKRKGTRAEHKAIKAHEAAGYVCTRAGGSLGAFDVIALGPDDVKAIQVKSGQQRLSRTEREQITTLQLCSLVSRECWVYRDRARSPRIERL